MTTQEMRRLPAIKRKRGWFIYYDCEQCGAGLIELAYPGDMSPSLPDGEVALCGECGAAHRFNEGQWQTVEAPT